MRRTILILSLVLMLQPLAYAQNPFAEYGYEVGVVTMTGGRFSEFHDLSDTVTIGNAMLDVKSGKIVAFLEPNPDAEELSPESISRFISPDPHSELYYSISPYVYVANNPLKYVDPDGKKIVNALGQVIYTKKGGWNNNANGDAVRISKAMQRTPIGEESFNKLVDASYGVSFNIESSSKDGRLGQMSPRYDGDKLKSVEITVYEGEVKKEIQTMNLAKPSFDKEPQNVRTSEKGILILKNLPSVEERIGQVAVHETGHATNKKSQAKFNPNRNERELYPNKLESEAIVQTSQYRLDEKIQSISAVVK